MSKRPYLVPVSLAVVLPMVAPNVYVTMSPGQWDNLLRAAYDSQAVLLELDDDEKPVRAFRRPDTMAKLGVPEHP